jgi:formiminotetrahydrofolate cyclodeaminase
MNSAYLNVLINVNLIKDESYVTELKERMEHKMNVSLKIADEIYEKVIDIMNK